MKGKRISDEKREKVIALYSAGESYSDISKVTKVSKTSVSSIVKAYRESNPDELERVRLEKRTELVEEAADVVRDLYSLLGRRVKTLLEHEDKLDDIIDSIAEYDGSDKFKNGLINKISGLLSPKLTEITIAMGTAYDKWVLMQERNGANDDGGGVVEIATPITITPPEDDSEVEMDE
jgi:transposase-like protein